MPTPPQSPLLDLQNITKNYGEGPLLENFNLQIGAQEFVTLLGPSGCGKTTVLRLIAGLEAPQAGEIFLEGENITHRPCPQRQINTVFQNYALFPHMNVFDNIAFGLRMQRRSEDEITPLVKEMLALVKLPGLENRFPQELSGGQQQRVALARALVNRPKLLLLDESLSALDKTLRLDMQTELKSLQRKLALTFIFVTHDQEEALSLSDKVVVMDKGRIQQIGTPKEVYELPQNLFVASFIGVSNFFTGTITEVIDEKSMKVQLLGIKGQHTFIRKRPFVVGDLVKILLRAEDLKIYSHHQRDQLDPAIPVFTGKIRERTYKGMTLDSLILLNDSACEQSEIWAREFFDEEDPEFDYTLGEEVLISWNKNWEVILPYED